MSILLGLGDLLLGDEHGDHRVAFVDLHARFDLFLDDLHHRLAGRALAEMPDQVVAVQHAIGDDVGEAACDLELPLDEDPLHAERSDLDWLPRLEDQGHGQPVRRVADEEAGGWQHPARRIGDPDEHLDHAEETRRSRDPSVR